HEHAEPATVVGALRGLLGEPDEGLVAGPRCPRIEARARTLEGDRSPRIGGLRADERERPWSGVFDGDADPVTQEEPRPRRNSPRGAVQKHRAGPLSDVEEFVAARVADAGRDASSEFQDTQRNRFGSHRVPPEPEIAVSQRLPVLPPADPESALELKGHTSF